MGPNPRPGPGERPQPWPQGSHSVGRVGPLVFSSAKGQTMPRPRGFLGIAGACHARRGTSMPLVVHLWQCTLS